MHTRTTLTENICIFQQLTPLSNNFLTQGIVYTTLWGTGNSASICARPWLLPCLLQASGLSKLCFSMTTQYTSSLVCYHLGRLSLSTMQPQWLQSKVIFQSTELQVVEGDRLPLPPLAMLGTESRASGHVGKQLQHHLATVLPLLFLTAEIPATKKQHGTLKENKIKVYYTFWELRKHRHKDLGKPGILARNYICSKRWNSRSNTFTKIYKLYEGHKTANIQKVF